MGRLIELLIVVALALVVWRLLRGGPTPRRREGDVPPPAQAFEPTVRCAQCGTHVPPSQVNAAGVCAKCQGQSPG